MNLFEPSMQVASSAAAAIAGPGSATPAAPPAAGNSSARTPSFASALASAESANFGGKLKSPSTPSSQISTLHGPRQTRTPIGPDSPGNHDLLASSVAGSL